MDGSDFPSRRWMILFDCRLGFAALLQITWMVDRLRSPEMLLHMLPPG
jgi:hypothetical protein